MEPVFCYLTFSVTLSGNHPCLSLFLFIFPSGYRKRKVPPLKSENVKQTEISSEAVRDDELGNEPKKDVEERYSLLIVCNVSSNC